MFADVIDLKKLRLALAYILCLAVMMFFQDTVFARLGLFGVKMLFIPAACVAVSLFEGGFRGGLFGLLAGLLCDLSFSESTFLFTLLFPAIGFVSGLAAEFWISHSFTAYMTTAGAALLLTALCQMVRVILVEPGAVLICLLTALVQTLWSLPMAAVSYAIVKRISRWGNKR